MIIRVIFVCLFLMFTASCGLFEPEKCGVFDRDRVGATTNSPIAPSVIYCGDVTNVGNVTNKPGPNEDEVDARDEVDENTEDVEVTVSHVNSNGKTIYEVGPGLSFRRQGGNSNSVWCKPGSNCNDVSRTGINVTSPPSEWVSNMYAEFRRSGDVGSYIVLNVDGQVIRHTFE